MAALDRLVNELMARMESVEKLVGAATGIQGEVVAVDALGTHVDVQLTADQTIVVPDVPVAGSYAVPEVGHQVIMMGDVTPVAHAPVAPVASAPPPAPTGLTVVGGVSSIQAHWDPSPAASVADNKGQYELQLDTSQSFDSADMLSLNVAATAKNVVVAAGAVTWYVRVRALTYQNVPSAWSPTVAASTSLDALAGQIGNTEVRDYALDDAKMLQRPQGWPTWTPILNQGEVANIASGQGRYRWLGDQGGLLIVTFEFPAMTPAGTSPGALWWIGADLGPPVLFGGSPAGKPSGHLVYGAGYHYDASLGTANLFVPREFAAPGVHIGNPDGIEFAVHGGSRLGQNPAVDPQNGDELRGFFIAQTSYGF